ncbi:MAG TPA: RHS repeat-associated core domain-containing protein [Acidimicrobiales bacterium]|nr:RHS repeat-associated core domain-containing protein [Acidimicrobiales bacterium]
MNAVIELAETALEARKSRHRSLRSRRFCSYTIGRYYDPATGQFLSVDPLADQTRQAYAYTRDNPVNAVDPLGFSALRK